MPEDQPEHVPAARARLDDVEVRWNAAWRENGAYVRRVEPGREKFFATYPYSYMNGFAHLGHAFTMMRNDVMVRYQRMLGKNALFPMGFHVTGTPIVAAAERIREGEPTQKRILVESGIPEGDVDAFADPAHWVRYFPKEWRRDLDALGLGVDWSREFHTTDLNPHYDAFIRWQFRRLRDGGYVEKGRHPIMWCPKEEAPVADHDRVEGEGETPQEFTLVKLQLLDVPPELEDEVPREARGWPVFLVAATLRPETMFGQTNVWVHPDETYVQVLVGGERWIVVDKAADKVPYQFDDVDIPKDAPRMPGHALVGRTVRAPAANRIVPVLPAWFVKAEKGTGVVTSVPSDAPYDLQALKDLKEDPARLDDLPLEDARRARARELLGSIAPIPLIRTEAYGDVAAEKALAQHGVTRQEDRDQLEAATADVYQAGFYSGTLLEVAGEFAGLSVQDAKDRIKEHLLETGAAALFYEPSGKVVCRCLTPSTVRIVSDQWFLQYSREDWKQVVHEHIDRMDFHPDLLTKQFHYVVDWLKDWACAREAGMGTHLPWDEKWIIESLSDSTIYMAYYTLAPYLERGTVTGAAGERSGVDPKDLTDAFFDHVLLGKGSVDDAANGTVTRDLVEACRREFRYWYPVDFRNSGKDLIQNHLTFFLFNHAAIWPDEPEMWPRAIAANGWLLLNGEKMSKSSGNFMTLRQGLERFGTTGLRLALVNAGEGVDDGNIEEEVAVQAARRMEAWLTFATADHETRDEETGVDRWFMSVMHQLLATTRGHMDRAEFRSAVRTGFFDLQREWAWYRRRAGTPSRRVLLEFIRIQNGILTPFVPHVAEEVHGFHGHDGLAIDAAYPEVDPASIDEDAILAERFVARVLDDVKEILKVTRIEPKRIVLYTAPEWKRVLHASAMDLMASGDLDMGRLMGVAKDAPAVKPHMKEAPKLAGDLVKSLTKLSEADRALHQADVDEVAVLRDAAAFLARELGGSVEVHAADEEGLADPAGKAKFATPRRPAIYVE